MGFEDFSSPGTTSYESNIGFEVISSQKLNNGSSKSVTLTLIQPRGGGDTA